MSAVVTSSAAAVRQEIGYCTSDAAAEAAAARSRRRRSQERAEAPRAEDTGADGPAMLARPRRPVVVPGDGGRIGRGERVAVDRLLDAHVIDRMWDRGQLDDRQHGAASRLYAVFCRAGLEPRFVAEPGERRGGGAEMDDATAEARAEYNRLVARHPGRSGELLDSLCHGRHPGTFFLAALQDALDDLARRWGERCAPAH